MKFVNDVNGFRSLKEQVMSQAASGKTKESEFVTDDDFITKLLNQDGIIKLGDYFFQIDLNKSTVLVSINKADLEGENLKNAMVFSTDENVLELMEAGYTNSPDYGADTRGRTDFWKWFCRARRANSQQKQSKNDDLAYTDSSTSTDRSYSAKVELEYNAVGIYFELKADVKSLKYQVPFWFDNVNDGFARIITNNYYFRVRCGRSEFASHDWPTYSFANSPGKCKQTYFSSTSALQDYEVTATFYYNHVNSEVGARSITYRIADY